MPREKEEEWKQFTVLSNENSSNSVKKKCLHCDKEFTGGADCIRFLLAGDSKSRTSFLFSLFYFI